ncbi:YcjF family protein [Colwellia sp. E2M01]|uniref:YcjF family protein n=1 Tax=Colwellia sp. E2M01 TaxID=2841561 RepID=UPI001C0996F1|nr:YcjF family protein [Colwellia sp. E2M01]MBU2872326.1 YcjF family protein [Colwellia sp. E2M01]
MKQDNNDEHLQQQQVLFDEKIIDPSSTNVDSPVTEQVVFDNNDYIPLALDENGLDKNSRDELLNEHLEQDITGVQGKKNSWLWRIIAVTLVTLVIIESYNFFVVGFVESPIVTSIYAALLGSLTIIGVNSFWRELVGLRAFKNRQKMKAQAVELLFITQENKAGKVTETSNQRGKDFCDNISDSLPCDLVFDMTTVAKTEQQSWRESVSNEHSSAEVVQLYSRVVLSKVDEKALNEVARFSTEAVVLIALSPIAIIDMLIMFTRNLRMINKISGLYGLKLSYWSRIKLIKQVFVNMAYAGASELIADFGSDMLGAELMGKLSSRFAQGLGAGMLTARLGAKTMELCRPIPFEEKPKLTQVRKKIAEQIKSLLKGQ